MKRVYNVVEVFYKKNGQKRSVLCNSKSEAGRRRESLRRNKRKFLGMREVALIEA